MSNTLNLHQRIVQIMATMGAIGKGGRTNYGDRFEYHRIDDIDERLREALVRHGVVATIVEISDDSLKSIEDTDKYGNPRITWSAECKIRIELVNADNPTDRATFVGWGQGLDYSDKATGKAISYAAKAAYLSAFHLRGQPDNEQDNITRNAAPAKKPEVAAGPTEEQSREIAKWQDALVKCQTLDQLNKIALDLVNKEAWLRNPMYAVYAARKREIEKK